MRASKMAMPKEFTPIQLILVDQYEVNLIAVLLSNSAIRATLGMHMMDNPLLPYVDMQAKVLDDRLENLLAQAKGGGK